MTHKTEYSASPPSQVAFVFDVYTKRFDQLRRVAAGLGLCIADAEDALQDVYLQLRQRPPKCDCEKVAYCWLLRVTVNRCMLSHRQRKRQQDKQEQRCRETGTDAYVPDASEQVDTKEKRELVRETLAKLDAKLLTPMVLKYFCDVSTADIADVLDVPIGTVHRRLHDGRIRLAACLKAKGVECASF